MFSQYFGNYLLTKGLVSVEELKSVMDIQKSVHVKIGIIAVNLGLMNSNQVEEIHHIQSSVDKKFGELAVEKGYLTESALDRILSEQKNAHLMLSQALMDKGYMSIGEIEEALNNYKRDHGLSDIQLKGIQNGDIEQVVESFVDLEKVLNAGIIKEYIALFMRNIIRFIDDDFRIKGFEIKDGYSPKTMVIQGVGGEINLVTGMDASEDVFIKFASRYADEEITEIDELAIESFGEFLNLHNGIFTVNKSNQGMELEITPQQLLERGDRLTLKDAVGVTLFLPIGEINLIIAQ